MKLTTKIVLGIILSFFLLSLLVIIGVLFIDADKYTWFPDIEKMTISQDRMTAIDVAPYQTIWIGEVLKEERNLFPEGTIRLIPAVADEEKNKLFFPEELLPYIEIVSENDTLVIRLKTDELYEPYITVPKRKAMAYTLYGVNFLIHTNTVDVICNIDRMNIEVWNIKTNHIKINASGRITIDSCQADRIEPHGKANRKRFSLTNSQVKELNIDLDKIEYWHVENCDIEVKNLTGSGNHSVRLPKSEAKLMNWIPKSTEARLTVTLYGDTAIVVFPTGKD
jgi:hypothetical protein